MMFVHDAPSPILFTKSHRQAEPEVLFLAVAVDVDALSDSRRKSHVLPRSYLYVLKVKHHGFWGTPEEQLPCCHIRIQSTRQEGRRYIEHQNVRIVIGSNSHKVLV